jgi:2-C-methyl-D-erythritol 4-phosphate cytidylyltransferase
MASCIALVVAAGRGTRVDGAVPKQYLRLGGQPLLRHALEALRAHRGIAALRVVFHPDDRPLYDAAANGLELLAPVAAARRGRIRCGSASRV